MKNIIKLSILLTLITVSNFSLILTDEEQPKTDDSIKISLTHQHAFGKYYPNSSEAGMGHAQIKDNKYEAVIEVNAVPFSVYNLYKLVKKFPTLQESHYKNLYNQEQQTSISNMNLKISDAHYIGIIEISPHANEATVARAKKQLNQFLSMSNLPPSNHYLLLQSLYPLVPSIFRQLQIKTLFGIKTTPAS